ncbi:MAG: tetratricopeptide repeat protein [Verrucomicrobia bacterium]|nr:tetratricopeptide repeat protein [Verrucomicrobiota bacterium]MBT7067668.1 tetratricopeptide repeat protein [Verrucomicrobiota bacterium]MBT7700135.1 tetratricopeptide repeat protein [Verrucomicrobiota bacterium]
MKKSITKKLLLTGVGLLLGVAVSEVALLVGTTAEARRVPEKKYLDAFAEPGTPATAGKPSAAGKIRMAVLGGSTSIGQPYSSSMVGPPESRFNLLSATRFLLEQRLGCPGVEIDNYAGSGWSAETTVDHYFERPGPRPDVVVLYTGQNETTRYYSPNMLPPQAFLAPLARLQSGNLLLRRLFTSQVVPSDQRYTGKFFSDNVIPPYERRHNLARYRRYVERMIRHAAAEGIFLVIVIPQGNLLFPPTRSVYEGPESRKAEALHLFKKAWQARHIDDQPDRALDLLEALRGFCSFADLYYALGDLHYSRGAFDTALPYLRRARETDDFPVCITPAYREVLHELVKEHGVAHIDMDQVIREHLGRPVPDYTTFLDDCHLNLNVYLELSRQIIRVMRQNGFVTQDLPPEALGVTSAEWAERLGITPQVERAALAWVAKYHMDQAEYTFLRLGSLEQARSYVLKIGSQNLAALPVSFAERLASVDRVIRTEAARMRTWIQHEGAMPIGAARAGEPPEGFGDDVEIEISQGNALLGHGEVGAAVSHYRAALAMDPGRVGARVKLATALYALDQFDDATEEFERALALDPQDFSARRTFGRMLIDLKQFDRAVVHLREAVRIAPDHTPALKEYCVALRMLAWRLATDPDPATRDGSRAVGLAEEACRITDYQAFEMLDALAAAHAETGRFKDAVATATRALELARKYGHPKANAIALRLAHYKAGRPWREEGE